MLIDTQLKVGDETRYLVGVFYAGNKCSAGYIKILLNNLKQMAKKISISLY